MSVLHLFKPASQVDLRTMKSQRCLRAAFNTFKMGEVDLAIRSLNITFNHVTNNDWSDSDVQRILCSLFNLYIYGSRYEEAAYLLEHAISAGTAAFGPLYKQLPHLYYNLAETYGRLQERELCKKYFVVALNLAKLHLGAQSRSFKLMHAREAEIMGRQSQIKETGSTLPNYLVG
jgi:hypothetical protein